MKTQSQDNITGCAAAILTTPDGTFLLQQRDNTPGIDFPGCWALVAGRVHANESPVIGVRRELAEELVTVDGSALDCGPVTYLGCDRRRDKPWTEYLFHVQVFNPRSALRLREGLGLGGFPMTAMGVPENTAPHHRRYILEHLEYVHLISVTQSERRELNRAAIRDFYSVKQLGLKKDYPALEIGDGYVESTGDTPIAGLHTGCDVRFIAILTFKSGVPRGFHYHLRKVESMTVLKGTMHCRLHLAHNPAEAENITIGVGQVLQILPGCVHTFTALDGDVQALEYAPQRYEASDVLFTENQK